MWLKFVFAFSYVFVLLTLSRIVNVAFKSGLAFLMQRASSEITFNPSNLTTKQLKSILDHRGIPHDNLIEKSEYKQLIVASGPLDFDELNDASIEDNSLSYVTSTHFSDPVTSDQRSPSFSSEITSRGHFYEMVEDTKDSAWLILVVPLISSTASAFTLSSSDWWTIVNKLSKFGIRIAVFDCSNDTSFCATRNWRSARLILSLPKNHDKAKSDVILKQYLLSKKVPPESIFRWIHSELAARVTNIQSLSELKSRWLTPPSYDVKVPPRKQSRHITNVIYVSDLKTPPLSISGLAIKFNGIANICMINGQLSSELKHVIPGLGVSSMVVTLANGSYYVCHSCKTFTQMNLIMKTLLPDMNDVFSFSLYLINISVVIHFFWLKCLRLWKHVALWLIEAIKVNCLLFLAWLAILALYRFSYFKFTLDLLNLTTQLFSSSYFGESLRQDFYLFSKLPSISVASFMACGCFFAWLRRCKLTSHPVYSAYDDDQLFRDWPPLESTILNYLLFRPINSVSTLRSNGVELQEGMELLIERLAVPNLWLQADLWSNEYIKHLPLWLHPGNATSSDECSSSDSEGTGESSPVSANELTERRSHQHNTSNSNASSSSLQCNITNVQAESSSIKSSSSDGRLNGNFTIAQPTDGQITVPPPANNRHDTLNCGSGNEKMRKKRQLNSNAPPEFESGSKCAICIESYRKNQVICGLPCGHAFHDGCIMAWLFRDNHICPLCRWPSYKRRKDS